jgi:enoyl-CoA hydratase/carnithine racemase
MARDHAGELVLIDDFERVRQLTMHRPDAANAFNRAMFEALASALDAAASDAGVSVVVLTGAGTVFSAGADINDMASAGAAPRDDPPSGDRAAASSLGGGFDAFLPALSRFPKPLVAAVNGAAVGIGVTMLLHCDIVLVSDRARLRLPFTAMGVGPELASTVLLPALVGRQRAAELLFTSEWIDAQGAVAAGLARAMHPHDRLLAEALALGARMATHPLASLVATKRLLVDGALDAVEAAVARENAAFGDLLRAPGTNERVRSQLRTRGDA